MNDKEKAFWVKAPEIKEICKNCNFFCAVREWPTYQDELTHICTYFLLTEREDYVLETKEYDMCECWQERKDNG